MAHQLSASMMTKATCMSMFALFVSLLLLIGSTHAADPKTKPYEEFAVQGRTTINDVRRLEASRAVDRIGTSEADSIAKAKTQCDSDTLCIGYYVNRNKSHL